MYGSIENPLMLSLSERNFLIFSKILLQGTGKRSQTQLVTDFEKMGARFDSYTSREHNAFYMQCFAKDVENGILIYSISVNICYLKLYPAVR